MNLSDHDRIIVVEQKLKAQAALSAVNAASIAKALELARQTSLPPEAEQRLQSLENTVAQIVGLNAGSARAVGTIVGAIGAVVAVVAVVITLALR